MNFKKEVYYPKYFNRKQYIAWQNEGGLSLNDRLDNAVKKIIEADEYSYIDEKTAKVFDEIISDRARELGIEYK